MAEAMMNGHSTGGGKGKSFATAVATTQPPPVALDFEKLLSRDYRPARLTRIAPDEKFDREVQARLHEQRQQRQKQQQQAAASGTTAASSGERGGDGSGGGGGDHGRSGSGNGKNILEEETARLVLSLVSKTPAFLRHPLPESERPKDDVLQSLMVLPPVLSQGGNRQQNFVTSTKPTDIEPAFHEVELGDCESKIDYDGTGENAPKYYNGDPMKLLERPRNHHLDHLQFDDILDRVDRQDGASLEARRLREAPLILELGVAGSSVAKHVYQNTVLGAQRPTPALKSAAYRDRIERKWSSSGGAGGGTGSGSDGITIDENDNVVTIRGTFRTDKEKEAAIIEARQKKRAQMAEDKKDRVLEAMETMAMGGGRGRTITSSLMGPGGTYS